MIVHGALRRALKNDPESAHLFIATLQPEPRLSGGLVGWIMVVAGAVIGAGAAFLPADERTGEWQIAAASVIAGAVILLYVWWMKRNAPA